jgi:hypothetical protein
MISVSALGLGRNVLDHNLMDDDGSWHHSSPATAQYICDTAINMGGAYRLYLRQDINFVIKTLAHNYGLDVKALAVKDISNLAEVGAALRLVAAAIDLKAAGSDSTVDTSDT